MHKWFIILALFSFNALAQEVPEHLEELLTKSQDYFENYNDKSASEIDDGKFDESEYMLFSQIDQVSGLDIIFSKEEIKNFKTRLVKDLARSFDDSQLFAIARIGQSKILNKKQASRFFEVALEYKSGTLRDIVIFKHLSPKFSPRR